MVTITHRHADEYVQRPHPSHYLFLVFGTDAGLISERARTLLRAESGGASRRMRNFSGEAIVSDPSLLLDEIHSLGLFDLTPASIRISLGAGNLVPALELALKSAPFEARIVVEAGPLRSAAPLRKWFESQSAAAAIECYSDQSKDLRRLIELQISSSGASIEADAVDMLLNILGEDRLISRTEIEKLCLYANCQRAITSQDVSDLLASSCSLYGGDIILECLLGNVNSTVEASTVTATRTSDSNAILSNLPRYMLAIHLARAQIAAGINRDGVLRGLLRSLNTFKNGQPLSDRVIMDSSTDRTEMVKDVYDLIRETRRNNLLAEVKVSRALIVWSKTSNHKRV